MPLENMLATLSSDYLSFESEMNTTERDTYFLLEPTNDCEVVGGNSNIKGVIECKTEFTVTSFNNDSLVGKIWFLMGFILTVHVLCGLLVQ